MKMKNLKIRQRALLSLHGGSLKITLTVPLSSILNSFHTIPLSKISTQLKHTMFKKCYCLISINCLKGELKGFSNLNFNIYLRRVPCRKQREREMDIMRMARQQALEEEERIQVFQGF